MASLDSILSSSFSEQRWIHQINKNFVKEVMIDINNVPVCVFNVPKSLTDVRPDAYLPQVIGLGPYHHMRPELYHMERYKISTIRSLLNSDQILNFHDLLIEKLKEIAPTIRACYHKYLDLDDKTLAWIMAIDGLFLLHLLHNYSHSTYTYCRRLTQGSILYRDVIVLENQIPVILLKQIRRTLSHSSPNDDDDMELLSMFKGFCKAHSPLKLASKSQFSRESTNHLHLLDLMYLLIMNRRATKPVLCREATQKEDPGPEPAQEDFIVDVGDIIEVGMTLGTIGKTILKPVQVVVNLPWDKISNLLGLKNEKEDNNSPRVEEISIPSVTRLSKVGGINFSHTVGGIRDVEFIEEEARLYLPVITLNGNSEVLLRNLVAYEHATSDSTLELAQYVDMMCGIIDTVEDVKLLRDRGIIKGNLSNEKIVDLFNGMNKSSGNTSNKIIEKINDYYSKKPIVKVCRFLKNNAYTSWKALTLFTTIVVLLLLVLHSFCQIKIKRPLEVQFEIRLASGSGASLVAHIEVQTQLDTVEIYESSSAWHESARPWEFKLKLIQRDANMCADKLAKLGHSSVGFQLHVGAVCD
ncbi:hypothetical protein LguiA_011187 [Lonicera macranthoides]